MSRVMGVDGCRRGWIGVTDDLSAHFGTTIESLTATAAASGAVDVIAIDIPIGLPLDQPRDADRLARSMLGRRSSSVFATPTKAALMAATHAEASRTNLEATGSGISQQAYGLRHKILEVDDWIRMADARVIEVHPEMSFAVMAGSPLTYPKSTWAGVQERCGLLASSGIEVPADIGPAGGAAAVDDVLDAFAAMWTARRFREDCAVSYPSTPQDLGDGLSAAIWV